MFGAHPPCKGLLSALRGYLRACRGGCLKERFKTLGQIMRNYGVPMVALRDRGVANNFTKVQGQS